MIHRANARVYITKTARKVQSEALLLVFFFLLDMDYVIKCAVDKDDDGLTEAASSPSIQGQSKLLKECV